MIPKGISQTMFYNHSRVAAASAYDQEPAEGGAGSAPAITKNGMPPTSLTNNVKIGPTVSPKAVPGLVKKSNAVAANKMAPYRPS